VNEPVTFIPLRMSRPFAHGAWAGDSGADVVYDNSNSSVAADSTTVVTTLLVGSGANRILISAFGIADAEAGTATVTSSVSDLDGALDFLTGSNNAILAGGGADWGRGIFYKLNPSTGTHTVTTTFSEAVHDGHQGLLSYANVHQTTPFGTPVLLDRTGFTTTDQAISTNSGDMVLAHLLALSLDLADQAVTAGTERAETFGGNWGSANIVGTIPGTGGTNTVSFSHRDNAVISCGVAIRKA